MVKVAVILEERQSDQWSNKWYMQITIQYAVLPSMISNNYYFKISLKGEISSFSDILK